MLWLVFKKLLIKSSKEKKNWNFFIQHSKIAGGRKANTQYIRNTHKCSEFLKLKISLINVTDFLNSTVYNIKFSMLLKFGIIFIQKYKL